jgi:hypothetical protein
MLDLIPPTVRDSAYGNEGILVINREWLVVPQVIERYSTPNFRCNDTLGVTCLKFVIYTNG